MVLNRVTIYGWIIDEVGPFPKSYALVDLVYFVETDFPLSEPDIFDIIRTAGTRIIPKRVENRPDGEVEQHKVIVEEWDSNVTVGTEQLPGQIDEAREQNDYRSRYNYPSGGMGGY